MGKWTNPSGQAAPSTVALSDESEEQLQPEVKGGHRRGGKQAPTSAEAEPLEVVLFQVCYTRQWPSHAHTMQNWRILYVFAVHVERLITSKKLQPRLQGRSSITMNVNSIGRKQISAHLQKHRKKVEKELRNTDAKKCSNDPEIQPTNISLS
ncbi:hypothetical protein C2845_PM13G19890 [Panicum miliaceum]|uniref:Uncharacterized protein n=1 Tax=Panicum miliaceum TaxID=4540 RepID=A0A3L6RLP1_PANMI|nr:hypothetical protein C2845_PM13G19890 [Panicum miliaceum]